MSSGRFGPARGGRRRLRHAESVYRAKGGQSAKGKKVSLLGLRLCKVKKRLRIAQTYQHLQGRNVQRRGKKFRRGTAIREREREGGDVRELSVGD